MKRNDTSSRYTYWYAKLLNLYPRPYRERFGESMEQTFNDLFLGRRRTDKGLSGFIVWSFTETSVGIIKERLHYMKSSSKSLAFPAVTGLIAVLPFMVMEFLTASDQPRSNFALPMFIIMWLFAVLFIYILMSVVRSLQARKKAKTNPALLGLKIVVLAAIAWSWVGLIIDQIPCFLGASGC